ncbi:phosphocholine cytidylyltransferase family protein [Actinoallomurus iriomotensis]|uniref:Transferase n=1 Tax=Actinoallomurus iriomotensis TaxID=478107 RepID=A0A9W6VTZ3_9ACTN|nr:phosphocholine cytidylyltransferase family protein [Actinoallomurus iriomotensis]GLY79629.1 transferase [Actinoallomurus iriomotensis]
MKGIILAAGRGSRLGPLTDDRPKCLVPLAGRTLLARQRSALAGAGVDDFALVAGYRAEVLAGDHWQVFIARRWAHTNMVASLRAATAWLRSAPCLVSYGDIVYSAETAARLAHAPGELAIAYDPHWLELWARRFAEPLEDAETFRRTEDGSLREIGGRARTVAEIEGQYMGLLRFTPASWGAVETVLGTLSPEQRDRLDMTGLLQLLLDAGQRIETVPCAGDWAEVDRRDDLELYESLTATGRLELTDQGRQ